MNSQGHGSKLSEAIETIVAADRQGKTPKNSAGIPLRPFGRHQEIMQTVICLGGHHAARSESESEDLAMIQRAIHEGITFLDNAWDYHDGVAEERMGKALEQGRLRDQVFLMTKVCGRDAKTAQQHLEDSLRRLRTDVIDLWQFHEVNYDNDPDWIFAKDGAFSVALEARKAGKVRYIGFTGHKDPRIHLRMLEMPKAFGIDFEWDSVQMPLNVLDARYRSFMTEVLPVLLERGIAPIGMKSLGGGDFIKGGVIINKTDLTVQEARRFVYSLPIATLVCGIDSPEIFQQDLDQVKNFTPMTMAELDDLAERYRTVAGDGRFEHFKSTNSHDGPYHQAQHGFNVKVQMG